MSTANPNYNDRVRYTLQFKPYGTQVIEEPEGWQDDDKEIARNEDYHGIFAKFSNSLQFVGNGADYILAVDELFGVNANIRLIKDERHPQTDIWEKAYEGFLDLSTMEIENGKVGVKFNSGGLEQLLKSRESETVEIDRLTTMDGKVMDPLKIDIVALEGRKILLNSLYDVQETDNYASVYMSAGSNSGGTDRAQSVGLPLNLYSKSHPEAQSVSPNTNGGESQGTTGMMFFAVSEVPRTLHITLSGTFTSNVTHNDDINHAFWGLFLSKYGGGTSYGIINRDIHLFHSDWHGGIHALGGSAWYNPFNGTNNNPPRDWVFYWEGDIFLNAGESLALEFYGKANLGGTFNDGAFGCVAESINATLEITENSYYEPTRAKFVLAHEMANRLIEIMTNEKTAFKSDFFGRTDLGYTQDGVGAYNGYTHGFWVRGFDKEPASTPTLLNSFKPLSTSWKDFVSTNEAVWNLGLGIETTGYKEKIVLEDKTYFYQNQVTLRLPNPIKKPKYTVATKYYYSGIEIGYSKGGDYEEAMGLDEYNAKSTFTTVINRLKNVYNKLSIYRADSYGKEFARRKPKSQFPTEDSRYDDDIFIMDLKRNPDFIPLPGTDVQEVYLERKWQDDFEQEPTGTYSPETATNLRLSPVNMLLRHAWFIGAGFTKYLSDFVRYGSSTANSSLKTKMEGRPEYAENGNIVNSELERARFVPQFVEFEHDVTNEMMRQIEGSTMVQGRKVPNVYGLIEFIDENSTRKRGYLINLKPNDNKFKLLIANR